MVIEHFSETSEIHENHRNTQNQAGTPHPPPQKDPEHRKAGDLIKAESASKRDLGNLTSQPPPPPQPLPSPQTQPPPHPQPHPQPPHQHQPHPQPHPQPTHQHRPYPQPHPQPLPHPKPPSQPPPPPQPPPPTVLPWPTHLRPFCSNEECVLVKRTHLQLQHSGFYYAAMSMEEAHLTLQACPQGSFLIRDSCQMDVFFTLSYRGDDAPTSVRILLSEQLFSLHGSKKTFHSLFSLLRYYMSSSHRLNRPYRRSAPTLQELCRLVVMTTLEEEDVRDLTGISATIRDFLLAYPHCV